MYKATGKAGLSKIVDVVDFYSGEVYDRLWGERIYQICSRAWGEKRHLNWHEKIAYQVADCLPPSPIGIRSMFLKILRSPMRRKIAWYEKRLFDSKLGQ